LSAAPLTDLPAARALPSLRTRLARHVLLPLALMWLFGTALTAGVAYYYAQQAFDRALLDDAYALASNVQTSPDEVQLKLSESELKALLFDQTESVYFAVLRNDGSLVGGHPWLHAAPRAPASPLPGAFEFSDSDYQGKTLRVVRIYRTAGPGYQVVMAQTTRSRAALLRQVLLFSFGPQAALLLVLAWWVRRAIGADLQPLSALQTALNQRDASDLAPVAIQATTRDVQQLGGAVNSLMSRIDAGVRAQREFAGNVAHELRTPLAGIRALAEYGLAQTDPQAWRRQLTAVAASEARASHMVEQLLALALANEARDSLNLAPVALDQLVRRVVLDAMPRADALGVDLGVQGLDEPVSVLGDTGLIEGALNNLLDNALRHGKPVPGVAPAITVVLRQDRSGVSLLVIDNGPGIAEDARQPMVQRWQQAPVQVGLKAGEKPGVGLGLAIVARYAALLGARLELSRVPGDAGAMGPGLCAGLHWPPAGA
jgi:two-component system, OmpR family, sensor histidine kinase TctE